MSVTAESVNDEVGVHDLGGRSGFGPVPQDDAVFHAPWEAMSFALTQFAQDLSGFTTDGFRHAIEREDPDLYLTLPYWHRWLRNAQRMLEEGGVLAPGQVDDRVALITTGVKRPPRPEPVRTTDCQPRQGDGARRSPTGPPKFQEGDAVIASGTHSRAGHTRLPHYVTNHPGIVVLVNDTWVFPDTNAHGQGEQPCWVYAVSFAAADLWNDPSLDHRVIVDLFEPYLERL